MPVVDGRMPVRKAAREGLQSGAGHCALINVIPRAASLSRLGVFACRLPPVGLGQLFRSSAMMSRMLGFSAAAPNEEVIGPRIIAAAARSAPDSCLMQCFLFMEVTGLLLSLIADLLAPLGKFMPQ